MEEQGTHTPTPPPYPPGEKPPEKSPTKSKTKFIDNIWTFVCAFLMIGPLALPLLWRNPTISRRNKVMGTVGSLIFTGLLMAATGGMFQKVFEEYLEARQMAEQLGQ